jgi:cyclopropane fatty-acyl-phospholipid synthase-like methyltransferase
MLSHTGAWLDKQHAEDTHVHDNVLSNALVTFFKQEFKNKNKSILDLGCGKGDYVKTLRKNGFDADGLDGNPHTKHWFDDAIIHDLSIETNFEKKYNWVLTLEVAEHLPKELEFSFISNVHNNNTDGIVMSWAIKGQGGWGHFNEQDNEYVIDLFEKKGYLYDVEQSNYFRNNCELSWFKNTILVFRKQY